MEQRSDIRIPYISFRSNGVMYYEVNETAKSRLTNSLAFQDNASKLSSRERYVGFVTDGVKKRMRKCITLLLQSTPYTYKKNPVTGQIESHKLSFVTLTTPTHENSYNAKWCHKNLLEPMLLYLRRKHRMKSYIWKVELQKNGQVHYHLTCDIVLHHKTLRNEWNRLLDKHKMLDDFEKKYGHKDSNSTDIHKVSNIRNLESYLVKYICKEYQNEVKLNSKIWDASKNIKTADYFKIEVDFPIKQYIRQLQDTLMIRTVYFDKAIYLDFSTNDYYTFFSENIINKFFNFLKEIQLWKNVSSTIKTKSEKILTTVSKGLTLVGERCQKRFEQLTLPFYYSSMSALPIILKE